MLNYMGPKIGPSTVASSLPPTQPGTIPAGIPGAPPAGGPPGPVNPIMPSRPMALSPALAGAINPGAPSGPPPMPEQTDPSSIEYDTLTQQDGTVVLFMKNPDGTRGPAVKIINVKAPRQAAA